MSLVPYTITALERDNADAVSSGKQVIVGATCSMFIQPANTAVQLFDNAAGSNGSTAKTTGANGQVTVYIEPGEYRVSVNGTDSFKIVGRDDTEFGTAATATVTTSATDQTIGRLLKQGDAALLTGLIVDGVASTDGVVVRNPLSGSFFESKVELLRDTALGGVKLISRRNSITGGVGVAFMVTANNAAELAGTYTEAMHIGSSGDILPGANGTQDLGSAGLRFDTLFATNGTINTSDANEKQDEELLNDAEIRVAQNCKTLLKKFRWRDMVEEKGEDARIHFGIIAQDLEQAFADEGLDAGRYGMFTSSTWVIDEETGEERTRLGVRYTELLAFIIAVI